MHISALIQAFDRNRNFCRIGTGDVGSTECLATDPDGDAALYAVVPLSMAVRPVRRALAAVIGMPLGALLAGFRTRRRRSRRGRDRRRQYRWLHPHDDDDNRAGDVQGRSGDGARARSGCDRRCHQRRRLANARLVRTAGGLTMRAPSSDLPVVLADVSLEAGATKILDSLNLVIAPGRRHYQIGGRQLLFPDAANGGG